MITRRAFGKWAAMLPAITVLPIASKQEFYTTFTTPVPAEDFGISPRTVPGGMLQPVEKRLGDHVMYDSDGYDSQGRSPWVIRDGSKVFIGIGASSYLAGGLGHLKRKHQPRPPKIAGLWPKELR